MLFRYPGRRSEAGFPPPTIATATGTKMNPANTKSRPQTKPLATNPGRASPFVDAFQYFESEPDTEEEEEGVGLRETASEVLARRKRTNGRKTGPAPAGLLLPSKANSISRSAPGTGTLAVLDDAKRKREQKPAFNPAPSGLLSRKHRRTGSKTVPESGTEAEASGRKTLANSMSNSELQRATIENLYEATLRDREASERKQELQTLKLEHYKKKLGYGLFWFESCISIPLHTGPKGHGSNLSLPLEADNLFLRYTHFLPPESLLLAA